MNAKNAHGVAHANPGTGLLLTAALVALAVACAWVASADASSGSGGVGAGGDKPSAEASRYEGLWSRVSRADRQWARATAECESGGNPRAIGGGGAYRGAFQFMKSTWRSAPKSPGGDPIDYSYKTQAVVAVALKRRDGVGHWPNCG